MRHSVPHFFIYNYMNTNETRAKVEKIFKRLTKLAEGGKANTMDFSRYLDELVKNGDLELFKTCMITRYFTNMSKYSSVSAMKSGAWPIILNKTNAPFIEKLRLLYKSKKVYQQGEEIRSNDTSTMRFDLSETLTATFSSAATASKIGFSLGTSDKLVMDILDPKIRKVNIYRVNWATQSVPPVNLMKPVIRNYRRPMQSISAGTYYETYTFTGATAKSNINFLVPCTNSVYVDQANIEGIDRIDLGLNITHPYIGDLEINIKAPNGNVINAFRPGTPGGSRDNFKNVTFTTSEAFPKLTYVYEDNTGGTWQMAEFFGIGTSSYTSNVNSVSKMAPNGDTAGDWELYIRDTAPQDNGKLNSWSLTLGALKQNLYLTQSSYTTQIPLTHGQVYQIEVETYAPYGIYNYRLMLTKNDLIGTINEVVVDNYLDLDYYTISPELRRILGIKRTFLEVSKANSEEVVSMLGVDPSLSEDSNLYLRYVQAIEYLLS